MAGGVSNAKRRSKSGSRRGRHWIWVDFDSGAAVRTFSGDVAEDAVSIGAQCKTATGELTTHKSEARISGQVDGEPLHRIGGRLVDAHKTLVSASKFAR